MRAISKCRPAAAWELRGPSRMPTASSRPADASWDLRQETLDLLAGAGGSPDARVSRRMHEGRGAQFSLGFMKPSASLAVRQPEFVRVSGRGRFARLCGSGGRHRIRVRDEPDGDAIDRRPPRCGAQRRALRGAPEFRVHERLLMTTMKAFVTRHPVSWLNLAPAVLIPALAAGGVLTLVAARGDRQVAPPVRESI